MNKACFTGHRPNKLGGYDYNNKTRLMLRLATQTAIHYAISTGITTFISGMAQGYDQDAAIEVIRLRETYPIKLHCYLPCDGQDAMWPSSAKYRYHRIIELADDVRVISPGPYQSYKMQKRNIAMVNDSELVIAAWNGSNGGTANTIKYADETQTAVFLIKV